MWEAADLSELLLEVVVHPGVEKGVVDGGGHGHHVGDEEHQGEVPKNSA